MKIMQVNIVYDQGSTGKIVADLHRTFLSRNIRSIVCYGAGEQVSNVNIHKLVGRYELSFYRIWAHCTGLQYGVGWLGTHRLIQLIQKENPDIVHLHCINGFFIDVYGILSFLKTFNIKTVITLHAEFIYTGNCGHSFECEKWKSGCGDCPQLWEASYSYYFDRTATAWTKMREALSGFDKLIVTSVSPWLRNRALQSPLLEGKWIVTIGNGIDTDNIFLPVSSRTLKEALRIADEKVLLHVTAHFSDLNHDLKGGHFLLQLARGLEPYNIKIVIVGDCDANIKDYTNVICVGHVDDQQMLAQYYSVADLTVITSKRETFSMPVAESLSCGTPVVGFEAGGPETIALKEYTEFVEYGNIGELARCVLKWINFKESRSMEIADKARKYYSRNEMAKRYLDVYSLIQ